MWKWVANKQKALLCIIFFKTAWAIAYPSKVDVPLPSSSSIIREFYVACLRISLVSSISTKKVDFYSSILSLAPSRVNILSVIVILSESAGTKLPIYASMTAMQVYLSKVDFPPMLGPVNKRVDSSLEKIVSFGINCLFCAYMTALAQGCLIFFNSRNGFPIENEGRHIEPVEEDAVIASE